MTKIRVPGCVLAVCFVAVLACADETAEKGRAVLEQYKDAVITVKTTLSMSMGGNADERQNEGNGTVIDPSGLTVLSLTSVDPSGLLAKMSPERREMVTKVTAMKMILPDGVELDAEIVLRDADLDLAFIRPRTAPPAPMACIDLQKTGSPQLLDEVVVLAQLGQVARRAHSVLVARIETIVEKPRKFYIVGEDRAKAVVCSPAFTLDGAFVGIGVFRSIRSDGGNQGDNVLVVIVSADDIREAAAQAPATAPAEEAPAEAAPAEEAPAEEAPAEEAPAEATSGS